MKQNLLFLFIALTLVAGGVFLGSKMQNNKLTAASQADATKANNTASVGSATGAMAAEKSKSSSTKRESSWAQLTEKYGDGRTKLSKKISEDMSKLVTDAMQLADMGAQMSGQTDAKAAATKGIMDAVTRRLGLTPEQLEKAKPIIEARVADRMNAVTELAGAMQNDPAPMMETILAGDALTRKEMSQEEYDAISADTVALLRNVSGFALGGRGGSDLSDPLLAEQLNSILTPEQQQTMAELAQKAAERTAQGDTQIPFQNGNLPAMDLEKLDAAMGNAQKLTSGLRGMMEGFKGMKDAFPKAELEP